MPKTIFGDETQPELTTFGDSVQPTQAPAQPSTPSVPFGVVPSGSPQVGPPMLSAGEFGRRAVEAFDPISQGLTFGFSDEITAPITAMITGESVEEALQRTRERSARISEEMGPGATILEIGGAALPAVVAGPAALAALPAKLPTLAKLGILGAAEGALAGAGVGETLEERVSGAGEGALIGGAFGVAGTLTAQAVLGVGRRIARRFGGAQQRATTQILRALERDEITPEDAFQRLRAMGDDAMIIDAGGENLLGVARATQSIPGTGKNRIADALNFRQESQGTRVASLARRALGATDDFTGTLDDLITIRRAAAQPAYAAAYAQDLPFSSDLQRLFQRPAIKQAWERAQRIAANEDVVLPRVFVADDAGDLTLSAAPDMRAIDYIKRGLDDIVEQSRNPITGAIEGDLARGVDASRKALLEAVDASNPLYATARAAFAGPSRSIDAMRQGRRLATSLSRSGSEAFDPDIIIKELGRMNDAEKQFFRSGIAQGLQDIIEGTLDGADVVRRIAGTTIKRNRLRAAFDSDIDFERFLFDLDVEGRKFASRSAVLGNSATARLQAEQADLLSDAGGTLANVATGRFNEVRDSALRRLLDRAVSGPRNASLSEALADVLTTQGNPASLRTLGLPKPLPRHLQRAAIAGLLAAAQQSGLQTEGSR